jgi:hypothetical protein
MEVFVNCWESEGHNLCWKTDKWLDEGDVV